MTPYSAPEGTAWVYDPVYVPTEESYDDDTCVFAVIDLFEKDDTGIFFSKGRMYRRYVNLETGALESFALDSRLNYYSKPLF